MGCIAYLHRDEGDLPKPILVPARRARATEPVCKKWEEILMALLRR
jgi:hypothetical protein